MNRAVKVVKNFKIKPYKEGKHNFENPSEEIEKLAQQRIETCKACEFFKDEKVPFLAVEDKLLPEASAKFCEDCGCVMSYKLRQTAKLCAKWEEKE